MIDIIAQLGEREILILREVAKRLLLGQRTYGKWEKDDGRNMARETFEEILDAQIYLANKIIDNDESVIKLSEGGINGQINQGAHEAVTKAFGCPSKTPCDCCRNREDGD